MKAWHRLEVRSSNDGTPRSRIAWMLRKLASIIDGRKTLTVDMWSTPVIASKDRADALVAGFKHAGRLFEESVVHEALEVQMREKLPGMYE